jgi:hypothetical protein
MISRKRPAEHPASGRNGTETALGQSHRFDRAPITSALPLRTDIGSIGRHVSKVPILLQKSKIE